MGRVYEGVSGWYITVVGKRMMSVAPYESIEEAKSLSPSTEGTYRYHSTPRELSLIGKFFLNEKPPFFFFFFFSRVA